MPGLPRVLTVAGSDSGGGAGIQADLKTFAAFRTYGMSAVTALTAQNTVGVQGQLPVDPDFVRSQIVAVRDDIGVDATKTGMLATESIVLAVARLVEAGGLGPLVVDPVMRSKHGAALLEPSAAHALAAELLPLATVVTPNIPEAAELLGCLPEDLASLPARRDAARALVGLGPRCAVVKGGHAPPAAADAGGPANAIDVWCDREAGGAVRELARPFVAGRHTHGTGCTFSAAVAAALAHGLDLAAALAAAKAFVHHAVCTAPGLGRGHGPLNHLLTDGDWVAVLQSAREAADAS